MKIPKASSSDQEFLVIKKKKPTTLKEPSLPTSSAVMKPGGKGQRKRDLGQGEGWGGNLTGITLKSHHNFTDLRKRSEGSSL